MSEFLLTDFRREVVQQAIEEMRQLGVEIVTGTPHWKRAEFREFEKGV